MHLVIRGKSVTREKMMETVVNQPHAVDPDMKKPPRTDIDPRDVLPEVSFDGPSPSQSDLSATEAGDPPVEEPATETQEDVLGPRSVTIPAPPEDTYDLAGVIDRLVASCKGDKVPTDAKFRLYGFLCGFTVSKAFTRFCNDLHRKFGVSKGDTEAFFTWATEESYPATLAYCDHLYNSVDLEEACGKHQAPMAVVRAMIDSGTFQHFTNVESIVSKIPTDTILKYVPEEAYATELRKIVKADETVASFVEVSKYSTAEEILAVIPVSVVEKYLTPELRAKVPTKDVSELIQALSNEDRVGAISTEIASRYIPVDLLAQYGDQDDLSGWVGFPEELLPEDS